MPRINPQLMPREEALLELLKLRWPGIVSRDDCIGSLFPDPDNEPNAAEQVLQYVIRNMRRTMIRGDYEILTIHGRGYSYQKKEGLTRDSN